MRVRVVLGVSSNREVNADRNEIKFEKRRVVKMHFSPIAAEILHEGSLWFGILQEKNKKDLTCYCETRIN